MTDQEIASNNIMKTVIYHSADYDGIFCREIARKFLGDKDVTYVGWNFGDGLLIIPPEGTIYVMDLPLDRPFGLENTIDAVGFQPELRDRIVWIDHHKSAIESHPKNIPGYRIDGVAACRLAWQWFSGDDFRRKHPEKLPDKESFIARLVSEPLAVRLAGEYDIWDKRDSRAETLQYALRTRELSDEDWKWLLTVSDGELLCEYDLGMANATILKLLTDGKIAQSYAQNVNSDICNSMTWLMEWEGLKWLCVNHARFNSLLFSEKDRPETGHDALLGFRFDGKTWMVSLYHAKHRTDLDLSTIAVKHGGGGHRGACGFTCKTLPFLALRQIGK